MDQTGADRTIVFLPGLRGDEDKTARFRACFEPGFRFEVLDFPGLAAPASVLVDVAAIADRAADEIGRLRPSGDLWLIGFSFGGCVAYEACRILMARGRRIGFLGLIDAPLLRRGHEWRGPPSRRLRSLGVAALRLATGHAPTLRLVLAAGERLRPARRDGLHWFLTGFIRRQAVSRWTPEPLGRLRSVVVVSRTFAETQRRWPDLLPDATVTYVPVEHQTMLDETSLRAVRQAFRPVLDPSPEARASRR